MAETTDDARAAQVTFPEDKPVHEPVRCSYCRRDCRDPVTGTPFVAFSHDFGTGAGLAPFFDFAAFDRVYPELAKHPQVRVCWLCALQALGPLTFTV